MEWMFLLLVCRIWDEVYNPKKRSVEGHIFKKKKAINPFSGGLMVIDIINSRFNFIRNKITRVQIVKNII